MAKVQISVDDELLERVDRIADANYMSRSGLISLACTQYINSQDIIIAVRDMSLAMRKIADTGSVDEETMSQLEDFERLSKMLLAVK